MATAALNHPNTIRIYEHGVTPDGLWFYAMELLSGRALGTIVEDEGPLIIHGNRIERLVAMTNLENRDAIHYLYRKLQRIGVIKELEKLGAEDGDNVQVGELEFTYTDW